MGVFETCNMGSLEACPMNIPPLYWSVILKKIRNYVARSVMLCLFFSSSSILYGYYRKKKQVSTLENQGIDSDPEKLRQVV